MAGNDTKSSLLSLVFTDLVGSTALKTELGDRAASDLIARHQAHVRRLAGESQGREIDCTGDGFFLTFDTPSAAGTFALRLQQTHHGESDLPAVRVGIHLGEVTERAAPPGSSKPVLVEGLAVDLASRIQGLAGPGQILMSLPVFDAMRQRLEGQDAGDEVTWRAHGPYLFQGIDDPVEIGEAGFDGISPLDAPGDSEKARRAVAAGDELTLGWRPAVGLAIPGRPNWHLQDQLGSGAVGEVWLAQHQKTHARRVFKFCFRADRLRGLKREVVLLRLLKEQLGERHDIAQIIDWEFEQAPYYLEEEYTEAGDLVQWSRQQGGIENVPLEVRLEIVAQIAEALSAAHDAGVLHKDLKPANVLISDAERDGHPKVCLTDFGIGLVVSMEVLAAAGITVEGLTETLLSSSSSSGAGTRLYIAPELLEGKPATPAADVYSLGVILYQMVVGDLGRALAPGWMQDVEDEFLKSDIAACVDGHVEERLQSAQELAGRLQTLGERRARDRARRRRKWVAVGSASLALLAVAAFLASRAMERSSRVDWARNIAIPEVTRLIEAQDFFAAFELADEAARHIPSDPALEALRARASNRHWFNTDPPGVSISYRPYEDDEAEWTVLGETPFSAVVPRGVFRFRLEKQGYEPRELSRRVFDPANNRGAQGILVQMQGPIDFSNGIPFGGHVAIRMNEQGSLPQGMLAVDGGRYIGVPILGTPGTGFMELEPFLIDRTEVTNADYAEFVKGGGYERPDFWQEEFIKKGQTLSWKEAMGAFRDSTGRPGPATWRLGRYEEEEGNYPVRGVSWYEAAAYAEFRGKDLPTIYHWAAAALPFEEILSPLTPAMVPLSNLGAANPAPVASNLGISAWGAHDMAGNVREWTRNSDGEGRRYILGGGWSDPLYRFTDPTAQSPWNRDPRNGVRCVEYSSDERPLQLELPLERGVPDFSGFPPLPDEVFETLRSLYSYDRTPLRSVVEVSGERDGGAHEERVTLDAAYGNERLILYIRLPDHEHAEPPYQAVIWFGGVDMLYLEDSHDAFFVDELDFFLEAGRAVVLPIYAGTFERNDGSTMARWQTLHSRREFGAKWIKDLGRTIDYLEEREDIDGSSVAFAGLSLGATVGPFLFPYESRLRVGLLWSGGMPRSPSEDAAREAVEALRRTTIPILLVNGRHDATISFETQQKPFFGLLGTPVEEKRHVVFETAHWPFPRAEFIKENLAWLDRYLGPVKRSETEGR